MWVRLQSCLFQIFFLIIGLIFANLLLLGYGEFVVPVFHRSKVDKFCREEGYWYGKQNKDGNITCRRMFATPSVKSRKK